MEGTNLLSISEVNDLIEKLEDIIKGLIEVTDKETLEKALNTTNAKGIQYMLYKLKYNYIDRSKMDDVSQKVVNESVHIYGELLKDRVDYLEQLLRDVKSLSKKINIKEKEKDTLDKRLMESRVYMVLYLYLGYDYKTVKSLYEKGLIDETKLLYYEKRMLHDKEIYGSNK